MARYCQLTSEFLSSTNIVTCSDQQHQDLIIIATCKCLSLRYVLTPYCDMGSGSGYCFSYLCTYIYEPNHGFKQMWQCKLFVKLTNKEEKI